MDDVFQQTNDWFSYPTTTQYENVLQNCKLLKESNPGFTKKDLLVNSDDIESEIILRTKMTSENENENKNKNIENLLFEVRETITINDLLFNTNKKKFNLNFENGIESTLYITARNPVFKNNGQNKENIKSTNKCKMMRLSLKQSWSNTEKEMKIEINEILKQIYQYYSLMFEKQFKNNEDFKKIRIFTEKERKNYIKKR